MVYSEFESKRAQSKLMITPLFYERGWFEKKNLEISTKRSICGPFKI